MKSPYYVATVINAYRRAIDLLYKCQKENIKYQVPAELINELNKASHRKYTTGFMIDNGQIKQNLESASQMQESKFMAIVLDVKDGKILVEQRNKFDCGDTLEVLSPNLPINHKLVVEKLADQEDNYIDEAKMVQQKVWIFGKTDGIQIGDILRKNEK